MNYEHMVLATTMSGEKMVGTFDNREEFEKDAKMGVATLLKDVRSLVIQESQQVAPGGQRVVAMAVSLMALPPFTFPVTEQYVLLSGWIYLGDHGEMRATLRALLAQAERREKEMRASQIGITLAGGNDIPPNLRG